MQAGIQAPSAKNEQVVTFVAVDDPRLLQQIAEIVDNRPVCRSAKAMVACVIDPRPVLGGITFAAEDCAAAVENMLLAVTSLGYASVWLDGALQRRPDGARRPTAGRAGGTDGARALADRRAGPAGPAARAAALLPPRLVQPARRSVGWLLATTPRRAG